MDAVVVAPKALLGNTISGPVALRIRDGQIIDVEETTGCDGPDGLLSPGLVDVQINGAVGVDFADTDAEGMAKVAAALPRTGVTRFVPTLITTPVTEIIRQARQVIAASAALPEGAGARPLGLHFEGPFLSPLRHGVHNPDHMEPPSADRIERILADPQVAAALRLVTLAPEQPGGFAAVRRLTEAGVVVAVGHTDATGAQTRQAADEGARMITHLFNAQRPLGHREPGVPGIGLVDPRFTLGLIADLAHVDGDICKLVFNAAPGRVALVTDAVAAAGMPPGRYQLGGEDVLLTEEGVPRSPSGTIAGSALTLDRAIRNIVSLGVDPALALHAASTVPANVIGEPTLGRLTPGARADLVLWDNDLHPRKVWVEGELVFDAEQDARAAVSAPRLPAAGN
ncbi:N-acetylglucosamine-6-phosphate deacetylase [Crossiella equi]|uniref:N-acetylglucosamine-6-phosphate deacetylase n=1 Tax=Crossiella equi TaxID=130796 RepID=A0ABS5AET9_9PSEU|nr:N-acetylglucosamine-6-phosphate deacetylase [Crossiella equi]MBP2475096.1 N-acetylglucosamine-6-phosphate deacetylase [Crossiella equi]